MCHLLQFPIFYFSLYRFTQKTLPSLNIKTVWLKSTELRLHSCGRHFHLWVKLVGAEDYAICLILNKMTRSDVWAPSKSAVSCASHGVAFHILSIGKWNDLTFVGLVAGKVGNCAFPVVGYKLHGGAPRLFSKSAHLK